MKAENQKYLRAVVDHLDEAHRHIDRAQNAASRLVLNDDRTGINVLLSVARGITVAGQACVLARDVALVLSREERWPIASKMLVHLERVFIPVMSEKGTFFKK